ncbi:hypothetical protein ACFXGT_32365 [Streptomyces sp. NPDC059352]|uniref:hypothetical protein n=1 Tax=Streptomyces sp. NPDC059352 TaxID=3346810 RepID=UPI00367BA49D
MPDIGTFIRQDFGSVIAGGAAVLAIPGVILAGHIQGKKTRRAGEARVRAVLEAAREEQSSAQR